MAQQVGSRRSLIVSLILTIAIAFGSLVATLSLGWGPKLGLDLAGGLSVVYKPATQRSFRRTVVKSSVVRRVCR